MTEPKNDNTEAIENLDTNALVEQMIQAQNLTLREARKALPLSDHQIHGAIKSGKLKAKRVEYVLRPEDIEEFRLAYLDEVFAGKYRVRSTRKEEQK